MLAHAASELPNECCGLFAGQVKADIGHVSHRFPLINSAESPTEYLSEPLSLLAAYKAMRECAVDILAVYHSHPVSPPVPSRTDRERNYYEDAVHIIISLSGGAPAVRGWWLRDGEVHEAPIQITGEDHGTK
jgi:proteasome lid subunit RPN8/RPN11